MGGSVGVGNTGGASSQTPPSTGAVTSGAANMPMTAPMQMNRVAGPEGVAGAGAMAGPGWVPGNMQGMQAAAMQARAHMPGMPGHGGQGPQTYPASLQQMHMAKAMPSQMGMMMPGQLGYPGIPGTGNNMGAGAGAGSIPGSDGSQGMLGDPSNMMGNQGGMNG
ncbi:Transcription factor TFIIIB component B [Ascosphaera pollenicola]|nr:Transcription factor TFIIIB component B [Ascosphaera pollenicola]